MSMHEKIIQDIWPSWIAEDCLGEGAYGVVYRARRIDSGTLAAIKVIDIPSDSQQIAQLSAEGCTPEQISTSLQAIVHDVTEEIRLMESVKGNTNIVSIEDYAIRQTSDAPHWTILIRMELLTPLMEYVALHPMTEADIVKLGTDLCAALDICRKNNIVHRDVKPENIFVNRIGDFKLGDFGVARCLEKTTMGLSRKGTPNYMAPELYNHIAGLTDAASGQRMDIYSLGMVLYWLSNRMRLPFLPLDRLLTPQDRSDAFMRRIRGDALPEPSEASPALAQVILKACSYAPENRYPDALAFKTALTNMTVPAEAPDPSRKPTEKLSRTKLYPVLSLIAALLIIGFIVFQAFQNRQQVPVTASVSKNPARTIAPKRQAFAFEDPTVEFFVKEALHIPSGSAIYEDSLARIYELHIDGYGLENINDLAHCINLTSLYLNNNGSLRDISALSGLTHLKELYLYDDRISDLSPLQSLIELETLHLDGNQNISDLTPLAALTHMKVLHLNDNMIVDLTPLSNLTELEKLYLNGNQITTVSPLLNLTKLKTLEIERNHLEDWENVERLEQHFEDTDSFRHDPYPS